MTTNIVLFGIGASLIFLGFITLEFFPLNLIPTIIGGLLVGWNGAALFNA